MSAAQLIREPAVAGRFYPRDAATLGRDVGRYLDVAARPVRACGVMAPHAGYVYSGGIAGLAFANVEVPDRVIVLCPNHTGMGERIAILCDGAFRMPGKDVPIDSELAHIVLREVAGAEIDPLAHQSEHAIEVELPFLVARNPDVRIVPMVLGGLSLEETVSLGHGLRRAIDEVGGNVLVVASSDMSHYLSQSEAQRVDRMALEPLLAFDPEGLYRTVRDNRITMCGFIPATAMLICTGGLGADKPDLLGYATSGEAFGDYDRVVGYASVVVS